MAKRTNHTVEPLFVQQIVDMYSSGKNQKEIVETTGQTYCVVRYWLKKKGVFDPGRRQTWTNHATQGLKRNNERERQATETRLALSLLVENLGYVGGYSGRGSHIEISCLACGEKFVKYCDRVSDFIRSVQQHKVECPACGTQARLRKEKKWEEQKRKAQAEKHKYFVELKKKRKEEQKKQKLDEVHICKECQCLYTYRSYAQSIGVDPIFVQRIDFCSKECQKEHDKRLSRKYNKTHGKHLKRCVRHGLEYDPSVTLDKMIERWGLRCAICGGMCDRSDLKIKNGARIYGDNYPSIDHIIPLALEIKGHTWDNVQVAHRGCNSRKGAKLEEKAKAV